MSFKLLSPLFILGMLCIFLSADASGPDIGIGFNGNGTFVPPENGQELVDNPTSGSVLWESGPGMGYQKSMAEEPGVFYGGVSSVIAADGMVFGNYFRPSGSVLNQVTENRYYSLEKQQRMDDILRKIDADDVTVAYDAATGATLWTAEEVGRGMNFLADKRGHYGITPAYGDGAVYVWGALGVVYAYDAQTGMKRWETVIEPFHSNAANMKAAALANQEILGVANKFDMGIFYNFRSSLIYLEGKVIAPNGYGALVALDSQTGNLVWSTPNGYSSTMATPAIPVVDNQAYLLIADEGGSPGIVSTVRMISPADGSVLWEFASGGANYTSLVVQGDKALISTRGRNELAGETLPLSETHGLFSGFRLTTEGPEYLWTLDDQPYLWHIFQPDRGWNRRGAIRDGLAYLLLGSRDVNQANGLRPYEQQLYVVDMATGQVLSRSYDHFPGDVTNPHIIEDRLILWSDLGHSWPVNGFRMYDLSMDPSQPQYRGSAYLEGNYGILAPTAYHVGTEYSYLSGRFYMKTINGVASLDLLDNRTPLEPRAAFSVTTDPILEEVPLAFNSTASSVADGRTITSYAWDFGDGSTSTEANPIHSYASSGNFRVHLSITDSTGVTDSRWQNVIVSGQIPRPPHQLSTSPRSTSEMEISWINRALLVDAFQVEYRAVGESAWQIAPTVDGSLTLYDGEASTRISGLDAATTYEMRVRSIQNGVLSPPSETISQATLDNLVSIYMEAECVSSFDDTYWQIVEDASVSNGQYLEVRVRDTSRPPIPGRIIQFPFDLPSTDTYYAYARAFGQSGANDSFYYAFNDDPYYSFGFCCTNWIWSSQIPARILEAGGHVLNIASREENARLDKIVITNSPNAPINIGPLGGNCTVGVVSKVTVTDIVLENDFMIVEFLAEEGKSYTAEVSSTMQEGDWSSTDNLVFESAGGLEFVDVPFGTGDRIFVRIVEVEP